MTIFKILCVCGQYLCLWAMHMLGAHRGQKRVLGSLELELWMVINHHVDAENRTQVFWKKNKCS